MADDPQQESAPSQPVPPPEADSPLQPVLPSGADNPLQPVPPRQESFGPPFPEAPANPFPFGQNAQPGPMYAFPPQPAYGYAMPAPEFYSPAFRPPASAPLPLGEALRHLPRQYWRVLTHPKAATFVEEQGKAAWNIIWMQLLILSIVQALLIVLIVFLESLFFRLILPSNALPMFTQTLSIVSVLLVLVYVAAALASFFICTGIYHLLAKAFGGQSRYLPYAYCYSLIVTPITILSILLSIIPCVGSLAGMAGGIYEIVLLIFMTMGVHRLKGGRASAAILIPVGAAIILVVAIYVAYFIFLFSVIPSVPHS